MFILFAITGVLLCLTCVFFLLVHPLISIVQCASSQNHSGGKKALWIILSLFVGIIGSLPYALFASGSARMRSLTLNGMKFGALMLALAIGVFVATPEIRNTLSLPSGELSTESMDFDSNGIAESLGEIMTSLNGQSNGQSNDSIQEEPPRLVSATDPAQTIETLLDSNTPAEMVPKLDNKPDETAFLDDIAVEALAPNVVPESSGMSELYNEVTLPSEKIESLANKPIDSVSATDNSLVPMPLAEPLSAPGSAQTQMTDYVPVKEVVPSELKRPELKRRDASSYAVTAPAQSMTKNPINRYRTEGYDAREVAGPQNTLRQNTLQPKVEPQPLENRNRYKKP